ncbi:MULTISPECIES: histidine kinase [Microbacterium]|uniref:Signal transduction histidine kinase subgroup 3 dimerisation and phosphoacceptor domain-containing protein n=1 Tax=Microbacterium wangchenii TaxID=2541726 RepID=A0ABX5SWF4_9MICO|nr:MULTISPECIES: histidine kinase [Microbacterium]MCK6067594.1 hypothetical protein [Microbacterium sp. EYE_512]QBR89482.1 hypothetical protein E4K62_12820 [Microbacterium wangchenii]TXK09002.1 hypothetical protein FVP99_18380 [Microbacterium wangchenii]
MAEVRLQPTVGALHAEAPIVVNGESWGVLAVDAETPSRIDGRDRLKPFADLMAAAIANAEHRADLTRSRERVIAAADEARRRLQRDVHDGAQQRLVHTILLLKLARDSAAGGGDVTGMLADALAHAEEANRRLRDVVRGILPAALARNGLAAGIESLAAETPIPCISRSSFPGCRRPSKPRHTSPLPKRSRTRSTRAGDTSKRVVRVVRRRR